MANKKKKVVPTQPIELKSHPVYLDLACSLFIKASISEQRTPITIT